MRLYRGIIIDHTGARTMLYLTFTMISSVDLAHYGVSRAKDWVSVDYGTNLYWRISSKGVSDGFILFFGCNTVKKP